MKTNVDRDEKRAYRRFNEFFLGGRDSRKKRALREIHYKNAMRNVKRWCRCDSEAGK